MSARMLIVAAGLVGLLGLRSDLASAKSVAARPRVTSPVTLPRAVTAQQAADILLHRPELGTLADRVAQGGNGAAQLVLLPRDDRPAQVSGQVYWEFGVGQAQQNQFLPLGGGDLLVRVCDGQVFSRDDATGRVTTFADWSRMMRLPTSIYVTVPAKPAGQKPAVHRRTTPGKHAVKRPIARSGKKKSKSKLRTTRC